MKKLFLLAMVAVAAWQAYIHYPKLLEKRGSHEAVIENRADLNIQRIRLTVDGRTLVKEALPMGATAVLPFEVNQDSPFRLVWQWERRTEEIQWNGGFVPKGPMLQRHVFSIQSDGTVVYRPEPKIGG